MIFPDYHGGSIANLMSSIALAMGGWETGYLPLARLDRERLGRVRNLVLLVVDGLGYLHLKGQAPHSVLFRHCVDSLTSVCPSTTATAIPTFLTGLPPQQHGLTGWFTYFAEVGTILTVLPYTTRLGRMPIDDRELNPRRLSGVPPLYDRLAAQSHLVIPDWIAGTTFNRAFTGAGRLRPYRGGLQGMFQGIAGAVDAGKGRNFIYAYWPEFDSLSHQHGVGSAEVAVHLAALDQAFAGLVENLRGTDTQLLVTADHGFVDTTPERTLRLSAHPELAETLMMPLCGEPRLAFCYVHPDRTGHFEHYVTDRLGEAATLCRSAQLLNEGRFGLGVAHPRLHDRIGHYALLMKENYIITSELPGERPLSHIGVHGGLSSHEMYVPLISLDCNA
ncbi:alkaline phosphatase family protein [Sedimenticola hydrogenitrophicus]|uniref:alkaline phosphatase family protein n=1 Tax=Sedimenticola hydrogenitrophicus TaxID=2967975 RepID=UPI0023B125F4|nr:alkaline phosphatase family protein [Sedimenticola hydrogenitrophicus]